MAVSRGVQHSVRRGHHARRGGTAAGMGGLATMRPAVLMLAKALMVPLASAAPLPSLWSNDAIYPLEDDVEAPKDPSDPNLYAYLGIAVALVLLGGAFAGLTIALMGQDETYLQVIATSGEGAERRHAEKVLNLLNKGKHWVLVTLLLSNVITNETLPIVLDRSLGGGWPAVLSSTILIVIFGEVVPQSICVRYGLSIGAYMAPIVLSLMWVMSPVAWPTAKLLDYLLGEEHGTMYKKAGLKTLVQLHKGLGAGPKDGLMEDEVTIINSVLDLKDKPVGDIMTPMQDVFTMSADTVLDERMMDTISSQGYSRIPIYAPDNNRNFIGMLLVKILITYDPEDAQRVRDFSLATLPETAPYTSCLDIINFFQEGKSHMVLVSDFPGQDRGATGVVTLEDVIEELIGEEIIDESDVFIDVHKAIRRLAPAPKQRFGKSTGSESTKVAADADDEAKEDEPLLKDSASSRKPSFTNGVSQPNFLLRRKSSNPSDLPSHISANASDIRPHLKHLGPSNVASHPRATKFTSVKIKPGVGTIPENQPTTTGIDTSEQQQRPASGSRGREGTASAEENEGSRLLSSGGADASGGATALKMSYGALDPSSGSPTSRRLSNDQMSAHEASMVAEQKAKEDPEPTAAQNRPASSRKDTLEVPDKLVVGSTGAEEDDDQIGDLEGSFARNRSASRRATRSGSITETTVEHGGMKKVVLETQSSSDAEDGEAAGSAAVSPTEDEGDKKDDSQSKPSNGEAGSPGGSGGAKKKKRKNKKKKGGDS